MGFSSSPISIPPKSTDRALIKTYDETRNFPAKPGTTRLGIHLRFGTISIRQLALEAAGLKPEIAEVTMRPENTIELTGDDAARMQRLLDVLEDLDDTQEVYHNAAL